MKVSDIQIRYKLWLHKGTSGEVLEEAGRKKKDILGKGGAELLEAIDELHDLGKATQRMNCSYKYAWNILQKIKKRAGEDPVITHRGGKGGGGGIELSEFGHDLLKLYKKCQEFVENALKNVAEELGTDN